MKRLMFLTSVLLLLGPMVLSQESLSPFYISNPLTLSVDPLSEQVKSKLIEHGFVIVGDYRPEGKLSMRVVCFTRDDLKKAVFSVRDRGGLASVLRVGLIRRENKTLVSLLNPDYMFHAYLRDNIPGGAVLPNVSKDARLAVEAVTGPMKPFGGSLEVSKLHKYHYMMGMPYFKDPVVLKTFPDFSTGVETIRRNLKVKKGGTIKVYEVIDPEHKIAVFGVGLLDPDKGEGHFLPIIGEDHLAAMPYEIILQGNEATMLHGRFRFALYWPELTMKTFTKIMSAPGDVEDFLKSLTE